MQSLWMLVASLLFSVMGVCVKLTADYYSTAEVVLCRGLVGVTLIYFMIRLRGGALATPYPRAHLLRGGIGVLSLWLWFYSFTLLPVATATTLNYMSSIWIAAILFGLSWRRGNQTFEWGLAGTVLLSFIGVAMLLRPTIDPAQLGGGLLALFSGFLSALVYLQIRKLGMLGEPEYRVVFYFSLTGLLAGLAGSAVTGQVPYWHDHSPKGLLLLLTIGLTATLAQVAMTRAFRLGNTLAAANLQYTGIVFASVWGLLIWQDAPGWTGWAGIALILSSGVGSTFYQQRAETVSEHNELN